MFRCCQTKGRDYRPLISTHLKVKWDSQVAESWCVFTWVDTFWTLLLSSSYISRWHMACRGISVKFSFSGDTKGEGGFFFQVLCHCHTEWPKLKGERTQGYFYLLMQSSEFTTFYSVQEVISLIQFFLISQIFSPLFYFFLSFFVTGTQLNLRFLILIHIFVFLQQHNWGRRDIYQKVLQRFLHWYSEENRQVCQVHLRSVPGY